MLLDKQLICEEDMGMPNATETDAAKHPDLQAAGVAGSGRIWAVAIVTTAPTAGTSIQVKVYDSEDDSSFAAIYTGPVIAQADAKVGKVLACFALPPDVRRYGKMALVGALDVSSGKASLFFLHEPVKSL